MRAATELLLLTRRALRETLRQPGNELPNVFIPLFFFVVNVGAVGGVARVAFGVEDYKGFQLPVAILQGAASLASGAGVAMTLDIQSGYFEKLLLTSTSRIAIVLSRMLSEAIKCMILSVAIIILGVAMGAGFKTGLPGAALLVVAAGSFTLAYSGIGMALALKTGSPQAAQAGFILFFPLLFLAPTFAPTSVFAGWLATVAAFNPVTYLIEGMRGLVTGGWDGPQLLRGVAAVAGIGVLSVVLNVLALRSRTS
jgi:ABC-2 type transport system permease protein